MGARNVQVPGASLLESARHRDGAQEGPTMGTNRGRYPGDPLPTAEHLPWPHGPLVVTRHCTRDANPRGRGPMT